jgi:hypothetical protein
MPFIENVQRRGWFRASLATRGFSGFDLVVKGA